MKNTRHILLIGVTCSFIYIVIVTTTLYNSDFISSFINNNEWNDDQTFDIDLLPDINNDNNDNNNDDDNEGHNENGQERSNEAEDQGDRKEEKHNNNNNMNKKFIQCPSGLIPLGDFIVKQSHKLIAYDRDDGGITTTISAAAAEKNHQDTRIEPLVHIMVESKCIKQETHQYLAKKWKSKHYSLLFHDRADLKLLIQNNKVHKFSNNNLSNIMNCITSIEHEQDILKLILLWEKGGIVSDVNYLFNSGGQSIIDTFIEKNDEAFFVMRNDTNDDNNIPTSSYDFGMIGAKQHHPISYMFLQKAISHLFEQYADEEVFKTNEDERRHRILKYPIETFFPKLIQQHTINDGGGDVQVFPSKKRYMGLYNRTISLFDVSSNENFGINLMRNQEVNEKIESSLELKPKSKAELKSCFNFESLYHPTNYQDLKDITDTAGGKRYNCDTPLDYMENVYDDQYGNQSMHRRKIPKIIHMTSKSRCLTKNYTANANTWLYPGHSIIFHDDDAVSRLIHRQWLEFPHLHDASTCITSGAGMADLWRYLMLWEYGGVYTDVDNSPGPKMTNGLLIDDDTDAFLEVEVGNFPSQYFIAVAPHHPLMYFAVNVAMQRLYEENNIVQQYVPYITGPGALKSAMIYTIANGNPQNGTHMGVHNRTVTMIGNRRSARLLEFINRGSVSNHEYSAMNMTHYSIAGRQKHLPRKPCLQVLYEKS